MEKSKRQMAKESIMESRNLLQTSINMTMETQRKMIAFKGVQMHWGKRRETEC